VEDFFPKRVFMKTIGLRVLQLLLFFAPLSPAAIIWDSFTVTVYENGGTPYGAIVDVSNLHWTGLSSPATSAQLQDLDYSTTLYFFTGVQQSTDGTVVPNDQALFTFDPTTAAHILDAYQSEQIYIGLYNGTTFLDGQHAGPENSALLIATPEPLFFWPVALVLALFLSAVRCHNRHLGDTLRV
jgi:hypothetical protein